MVTFARLLFTVLLGVAGYGLARRWPPLARRLFQGILFALAVGVSTLALSGALHDEVGIAPLHRWLGHALVIIVWLSVPWLGGILFRWRSQFKSRRATAGIVLLLLLLVATLLGSITGYLDVIPQGPAAAETHRRFVLLHFFVFPPGIAALLAGLWFLVPRSYGNNRES